MAQGDQEEQPQTGSTNAAARRAKAAAGAGDLAASQPRASARSGRDEDGGVGPGAPGDLDQTDAGRELDQTYDAGELDQAEELEEVEFEYEYADELGEPAETIDEQGRRHIRRAAPEGTEQILEAETPRHTGLPDKAERWRVRSATGTVLTAFAFGLQNVFEPDRNQPAIVMETSGDPPRDLPVEAQLEQLGPRQSSVTVRSWLLGNNLPGTSSGEGPADGTGRGAAGAHDEVPDGPSNGAEHPTPAAGEETGG